MNPVASQALLKLLRRAESASGRSEDGRTIGLRFSSESLPAYSTIGTHAEKEACHGDLLLAERDGAIAIEWDRRAGQRNQILRIQLKDREALARHLGVLPRWDAVARAAHDLGPFLTEYPVLDEVLASWRRGAKVRGTGPEDVKSWRYAVAVVSHCRADGATDVAVRRLSAQLTGDSKRVEQLSAPIDVLIQGAVAAPIRDPEDVFNELGLVKFPPTMLISGALQARVGAQDVLIDAPYLGFPPSAITGFASCETVILLLTVENLTTFHELVGQRQHMPTAVLLYTGGMPSPSWKRVYRLLLRSLPVDARVLHWGDIDGGGFRIADHLAVCAAEVERRLELHGMTPTVASIDSASSRRPLANAEVSMIERLCARWNWDAAAQ
jgi:hypothetical protein